MPIDTAFEQPISMQNLMEILRENNRILRECIDRMDPTRLMTRKDVMVEYGVSRSVVYRNQRALGFDPGDRNSRIRKMDADRFFLGSN